MGYRATTAPFSMDPNLAEWLTSELAEIERAFVEIDEINLPELNVEPEKPRDGMIVLADGTNWNPGSGAGYYGFQSGSWTFLG